MKLLFIQFIVSLGLLSNVFAQSAPTEATASLAAELAAILANQQAKKEYSIESFSASDAKAVFTNDRWTWKAIKGFGTGDIQAEISFAADGTDQHVSLKILSGGIVEPINPSPDLTEPQTAPLED